MNVSAPHMTERNSHGGWDHEIADWSELPVDPLVSVCMITYRHAPYIRQALDSVLMQQTDFPVEICIGEDGSTDGTREICRDYAAKDPQKIRLFLRSRENPERSRYRASFMYNGVETLKSCRGKYIAVCEGDDYWTDPLKLEKQVELLDKDQGIAISCHNLDVVYPDGRLSHPMFHVPGVWRPHQVCPPATVSTAAQLAERCFVRNPSAVIRKDLTDFKDDCLLQKSLVGDWPFYLLLAERGSIHFFPKCMAAYRVTSAGEWSSLARFDQHCLLADQAVVMARNEQLSQSTRCILERTATQHIVFAWESCANSEDWGKLTSVIGRFVGDDPARWLLLLHEAQLVVVKTARALRDAKAANERIMASKTFRLRHLLLCLAKRLSMTHGRKMLKP